MLTMLGGMVTVYPSLTAQTIQSKEEKPMAQKRELQTNFSNEVIQTEISPKWIRVNFGGKVIADSHRVLLLREKGHTPVYYFPEEDVEKVVLKTTDFHTTCERKGVASYYTLQVGNKVKENAAWYYPEPHASDPKLKSAPDLRGYVAFYWDMMDGWYEEGEEVFVHPRDPYHRIDVLGGSRKMRVVLGGLTVAETDRPVVLYETGLLTRYYIPKADVRVDLLEPSNTITRCPYKGEAHYYSLTVGNQTFKDVVWYYRYPTTEASKIANHLAFYNEKVDAIFSDGHEVPKSRARS